MAEIKIPQAYRVEITEYERGRGSKVGEVKYFTTTQEARNFCTNYNKCNPARAFPFWYMQANYCGKVR